MEAVKKEWKILKSAFEPDPDDEEKKNKKQVKKKKNRDDSSSSDDDSSINSEDMELAADITADVFTAGMYGTVTGTIEAVEGIEEYQKYRAEELKRMKQEEEQTKQKVGGVPTTKK